MTAPAPGDEGSYLVVVGEDRPGLSQDELLAINDRYSQVHLPDMVGRNKGFLRGTFYQLIEPDPRGDLGPGWLTVYELSGADAAASYLRRAEAGDTPPGYHGSRIRWHVIWRRYTGYEGAIGRWGRPYLYLIGMDVPPGTSDEELAAFNKFYDELHVPEVVAVLGHEQGLRFERLRSLDHPEPGCPQFMATYDGDEKVIRTAAEGIPAGAIRLDGPPAWNNRRTQWRLLYRRVASCARLTPPG